MFANSEEYKITNEIVLFYRPSIQQLRSCFKQPPAVRGLTLEQPLSDSSDDITDEDKHGLVIIFGELTYLSALWCKK